MIYEIETLCYFWPLPVSLSSIKTRIQQSGHIFRICVHFEYDIRNQSCSFVPLHLVYMPKDNILDDLYTNDEFSNVDLPLVIDTKNKIM